MGIAFERRAAACRALARLFPLLALALAIAWPGTSRAAECPIDIISATVEHGGSVTIDIPPCRASAMAMGAAPTCGSATFVDVTQTQILYDHDAVACPDATGDQFEFFGPTFDTIIVQVTIEAGGGGGPPPPPPPVALPGATVGVAYDEAIGPTGVATYTLTAGALPAGLALDNGTASISGTPTAAGNFAFTITATDFATSTPVPADFTLVVGAPTVIVGGAGTYNVDQGLSGADMLQANGGTAPYAFAVTDGALPPGMSLAADGTFSGTFTTAGTFSFDVTATDSSTGTGAPFTGTASFTFEVAATAPTITLSPATLDDGTVGVAYAASLSADGGTAPYAFAVTAGALPAGLSLAEDGSLSGTPSVAGTANFTVTATDDDGFTGSQALSITVVDALTASISAQTNIACAGGTTGAATVLASGGTAPYTYAWSNSATTATITGLAAGTYDVTVTDDNGLTATAQALITEPDPLAFTSGTLPDGTVGVVYSQLLGTSGGSGANTFSIIGVLPDGLALSGATISGTPTTAGTTTFEVEVQDANACSRTIEYEITIAAAAPTITLSPASLPDGYAGPPGYYGLDYSATLSATGGTAPYTYAVTAGALPDGLQLDDGTGALSGLPTAVGTFDFTVTATDSDGFAGSGAYSIVVRQGLAQPTTSTTDAKCAFSSDGTATVTTSGGATPYRYLWVTGATTASIGGLEAGSYNVTVTDANGISATADAVVGEPTQLVLDTQLNGGVVGKPYSVPLLVDGGTGTKTISIDGALPPGISLVGSELKGTPTAAGTSEFDVVVEDANACTTAFTVSITIEPRPVITLSPASLPAVFRTGEPVSIQLTAAGGTGPYTFRSGALPSGIKVSSTGLINGAPTQATDFNFTIEAVDARGFVGTQTFRFVATDALSAVATVGTHVTCPGGDNGTASADVKGGRRPYAYAWSHGHVLPAGDGQIVAGLPAGDVSVDVTSDDGQTTTATATVVQPDALVVGELPGAVAGAPYSHALIVSGGTGRKTVTFPRGLPKGFVYTAGVLSGTPGGVGPLTFDATITDTKGCVAQQRLSLDVRAAPPVANDDAVATTPGAPLGIAVTANDTGDIDAIELISGPAAGAAVVAGLVVDYMPPEDFTGVDVFTYIAKGPAGDSAPATVKITVSGPRPVAWDDVAETEFETTATIPVAANDEGRIETITLDTLPAKGTAVANGLQVDYTPDANFFGTDTFTYVAKGPSGASNAATVSVTVLSPGAPIAKDDTASTEFETPVLIEVWANDVGIATGMVVLQQPANGVAASEGMTHIRYTPNTGFSGTDTFIYVARGPGGDSKPAKVTVMVSDPPARPPVAADDSVSTAYLTEARIPVTANDEGEIDSIAIARHPSNGVAKTDGLEVVYFPNQGFHGEDTLTYTASGPGGVSGPAVITVKVDEPMFSVGPATLPRATAGKPYSGQLTASGSGGLFRFYVTGLPAGLDVNEFTGKVSGTPTQAGTFSLAVTVTDSSGASGTGTVTLVVEAVAPTAKPANVLAFQGTTVKLPLLHNLVGSTSDVTAATILDMSPADAGSLSDPAPPDFYPTLALATTFLGEVKIRYTLSSAYATSEPITLVVKVGARQTIDLAPIELNTSVVTTKAMTSAFVDAVRHQLANAMNIDVSRITISNAVVLLSPGPTCGPLDWHTPGSPCRQPMLGDEQMPVRAPDVVKSDRDAGNPPPPFRLWTSGTVRFGDQDARGGGDGFEFETSGVAIGADKLVAGGLLVGGALGYGRDVTDIGTDGTRNRTTSVNLALYGRYQPGDVFVDAILGRQQLDFDFVRYLEPTGGRVRGERDGHQWFGSLGVGYEFDGERLDVSPYGRVDIASGQLDAYAETGDPTWALAYDDMALRSTTLNLGVRMDGQVARDWGVFSPSLDLEYQRDVDDGAVARIRYADLPDGPLYRVEVPGFDRNRFMLGVGFGLQTRKHLGLQLQWRTLLGNSQRSDNAIHVNVSKRF